MNKKAVLAKGISDYKQLGINKETAVWEDGMRSDGGRGTYEWWYFDAKYSDGTKVVVIFYTKNGFDVRGLANPTASLEITFPNGKKVLKHISEEKGQKIRASRDQCDVKIAQSSIKYLKGNYLIHFIDDDVEYTCTMKPKLPMWRPGTGHWYYGKNQEYYFAWIVPQPSADVRATLKACGETFELTGGGYHDHNWGNTHMRKLMNHWYWCRVNVGPYTIIACDIITEKKYGYARLPVMMIAKDGIILDDNEEKTIIKRLNTKYHPISKKFFDNNLMFIHKVDDVTNFQIEFKRKYDILAFNMLDRVGNSPIKIGIAKVLGFNPTYIRCIGDVKLTVEENGEKKVFEEEGLWEQMFFGSNKDAIVDN
ncbi:lipocalin-like domain-containing protein [Clostridium psychrophilum]|uniref:lipocalin-like domain-containing protein n=1 Tax=Clostridium psychrophilum TaxID=132926 RepID=UPI001C0DA237|nr:lipocalin-like domain-containing protein [Clostridium psychrophilum]MBU3180321.1 hypothetical protein [Clostridium psychrophilum]